jgi:hypothetical protein
MWDDCDIMNTRLHRNMAKYTCERNHPSQNEPQKIHISWWNKVSPDSMVGPSNDELPYTGPSKKKASSNFSQRWRNAVEKNSILASAKAISEKLLSAEMKQEELRQQLKKVN